MHVGNLQKKPGYVKAKPLIGRAARDQDCCVQHDKKIEPAQRKAGLVPIRVRQSVTGPLHDL